MLKSLFAKESILKIVYLWLILSIPITFLLTLLSKVALTKELVTELEISLSRIVILERVSILEVGVRIVDKFLLRVLLKTSSIWILIINSSGISLASGVAAYSLLIIC